MDNKTAFSPRFRQSHYLLMLLMLLFLLALPGCKRGTPEAEPTADQGLPAANVPAANLPAGETAAPVVLTATASAGGAQPEGSKPAAAPSPTARKATPTACQLPPDWVVYTILPGDTLWSLASSIGSSVDEIKRGNCKDDDRLVAYETIHLPKRPPARPAAPQAPASTVDPCASIFSCASASLPSLALPVGGPNEGTFIPCDDGKTGPRIDFGGLRSSPENLTVRISKETFFFTCGFDHPENLRAWMTGPGDAGDLKIEGIEILPPGAVKDSVAASQKVVAWYPACDLAEGAYTLYVSDDHQTGTQRVDLKKNNYATIMVKPKVVRQGTDFDIFYCGYSAARDTAVQIDLFRSTGKKQGNLWLYDHLRSWDVRITSQGWFRQRQIVPFSTPADLYVLEDHPDDLDGEVYFWIVP